jgi:enolase
MVVHMQITVDIQEFMIEPVGFTSFAEACVLVQKSSMP